MAGSWGWFRMRFARRLGTGSLGGGLNQVLRDDGGFVLRDDGGYVLRDLISSFPGRVLRDDGGFILRDDGGFVLRDN